MELLMKQNEMNVNNAANDCSLLNRLLLKNKGAKTKMFLTHWLVLISLRYCIMKNLFLNGTCLNAGYIAMAIVDGKEDGAGNHNYLKCSPSEFICNGIQTDSNKNRNEKQPVPTEQLKFIIPITTDEMNDDVICKETEADIP